MKSPSIKRGPAAFPDRLSKPHSILPRGRETVRKAAKELSATLHVLHRVEEDLADKQTQLAVTQQALEAERQRYRALFDFSPDAHLVTNLQGSILEANRAASIMLHVPQEMLSRQLFLRFVAGGDRRRVRLFLFELRERGATQMRWEMQIRPQGKPCFPASVVGSMTGSAKAATPSVRWLLRDISERKKAERTLRDREAALYQTQAELRALTAQLLTAQDQERQRIARDLHDDVIQRLALLAIDIEVLEMQNQLSPHELHETLCTLHRRVVEISNEIRGLAHHLHPGILQDLGLPVALQRYVSDFSMRTGLKCTVKTTDFPESLPMEIATSLYKILLECLGNVLKHANASDIAVELAGRDRAIQLTVTDNGRGFLPEEAAGAVQGLGFVSMRERARILHGECTVQSQPGQGTIVNVKVPL